MKTRIYGAPAIEGLSCIEEQREREKDQTHYSITHKREDKREFWPVVCLGNDKIVCLIILALAFALTNVYYALWGTHLYFGRMISLMIRLTINNSMHACIYLLYMFHFWHIAIYLFN